MARWVSLGLTTDRAERTAMRLRRIGVMLDRFQTRGADPDEAAVCRSLHVTLDRLATAFEELSCAPGGGCADMARLAADLIWFAEEEELPDVPRDGWGRFMIGPAESDAA